MSEYWKSTPKYWCKHCSVYVRDTKLERTNHEATVKHQSAIRRSLRDIHRGAEREEREKERARGEVDRLNGVVSGKTDTLSTPRRVALPPRPLPRQASQADRQRQMAQLAELGVSVPAELRGEMAMPGEWQVLATKVVRADGDAAGAGGQDGSKTVVGVKREREKKRTEEEREQEEAIQGLFKKRRAWTVGSKTMHTEEDVELDALLNGSLVKIKQEDTVGLERPVKEEDAGTSGIRAVEDQNDGPLPVKTESDHGAPGPGPHTSPGKHTLDTAAETTTSEPKGEVPAVVFKKRKPRKAQSR